MSEPTNYLSSDNVKVFPYGQQRPADPYGRILNEANIARMVRSLTDRDSYIVSYKLAADNTSYDINLIIHGYYFELTGVEPTSNLTATIYTTGEPETLYAGDSDGKFKGICLHTDTLSEQGDKNQHSLNLFDSSGSLNEDSLNKISVASIEYDEEMLIDCGSATTVI